MTQVIIVGAGVIGCSIGLELQRRGVKATVVDRHGAAGHGSTSASCGIVRCFYSTPTLTAMAHEATGIWRAWGDYLGVVDRDELAQFEQPGMLFLPPAIDAGIEGIVAHMHELGVDAEILSPREVALRFPFLDTRSQSPIRRPDDASFFDDTGRTIAGGVFESGAGYVVSPQLATQNLRVAGENEGVEFVLGRRITAIDRAGGKRFRVVLEDHEVRETDVVVNAAGPHSSIVNQMAEVVLPIETRPLRRETHAVANPEFAEPAGDSIVPVVGDVDSGIYFRPESGGRDLIVGSLDPDCDTLEWVDAPDDFDPTSTEVAFERQVMRLMKRFPDVGLGRRRGIAGMYNVTLLDWNPVLDRTELPGFYVAIGTSGSSFKTAPVIGSLMAELIDRCESGHDHDRDPVRASLPRTGFEVNIGFFSRLRAAHETSGTVLA